MKFSLPISISGRVVQGDQFGRVLGFPTANVDRRQYVREKIDVRLGVYAGIVDIAASGKQQAASKYKAGIVIGPIDKKGLPKIEAHLLGFSGNLYGKKITLQIQKFIRPWKNFKNMDELKVQIKLDIDAVKKL
jgi:riboflavin kinase/FMN adenylyltransferase